MNQNKFRELIAFTVGRFPVLEPYFYIVPPTLIDDETWAKTIGKGTPTACVTARGMFFADSFLSSLPRPKQIGLVLHEVLHLVRQDLSQPWVDRTLTTASFRMLANIAQDHCIERIIADMAGLTSGKGGTNYPFLPNYEKERWDKYPANTPWRTIYKDLKKNSDIQQGGGVGGVDEPGQGDMQELMPLLERAAKEAEQIAERLKGEGKSSGAEMLVKAEPPTVPWREVLRDHLLSIPAKVKRTWSCVNRRAFGATGAYVAGRNGSALALREVSLYVDTSGSMHATLGRVAGDIMSLLASLPIKQLTIVYYDTGILRTDVVESHQIAGYKLVSMPAGGGTRVAGAMAEEIEAVGYRPYPTIVLTDGYDDYQLPPAVSSKIGPVVWCSYEAHVNSNTGISMIIPKGDNYA